MNELKELKELKEETDIGKSIIEIDNMLNNYNRDEAIELIKKVRQKHASIEQIVYIGLNVPLERCSDQIIKNNLLFEKGRISKLGDKNAKD